MLSQWDTQNPRILETLLEAEPREGWEGYVQYYSFEKGSGRPLNNRDQDKVNRRLQRHQERSEKNSFNEKV